MYELFYFHWHFFTLSVIGKKSNSNSLIEHKLLMDWNKVEPQNTYDIMNWMDQERLFETPQTGTLQGDVHMVGSEKMYNAISISFLLPIQNSCEIGHSL